MDRKELVNKILTELKESGKYDALDEIVLKFPNDICVLHYSCILFEQMNSDKEHLMEHITFWELELESGGSLSSLLKKVDETRFSGWPKQVSIEVTSCCNARCRNCTHGELIKSGKRIQKIVDIQTVFYRIRKTKLITLLFHTEVSSACPVGLGEPLTHPNIAQIISYMEVFFPTVVGINTNAGLLTEQCAEQLIEAGFDYIYLSLSYFDKDIYEKEVGLNYDTVIDNICNFLEMRKKTESKGQVIIHIFDNTLNSEEDIKRFKDKFRPLLQKQDALSIREYIEFVENEINTRMKKREEIRPCYELWDVLMIDVDGNIYPCCMGVWKEYDPYLAVGNMEDDIDVIVEHVMDLRKKQFEGDMGSCLSCATLKHNMAFHLPLFCYDKSASIHGDIQYMESCFTPVQLSEIEKQIVR